MSSVKEIITMYNLADYKKNYKNVYGELINLKYPLTTLMNMEVKEIHINFKTKEVELTIVEVL